MPEQLLPTTVVGSYPQPDWLVNKDVLKSQTVPRVRLKELWRVAEPYLEQAQDDATMVPRVVGKVRRRAPVELRDMQFLRRNTAHKAKITLPGPFTMTQQVKNEF